MNRFKIGDIIYNLKHDTYHDIDSHKGWHHVIAYEKFRIINKSSPSWYVEIFNIANEFSVNIIYYFLSEEFITESEYRKIKLKKLNTYEQ
jgi:hypothetical protein